MVTGGLDPGLVPVDGVVLSLIEKEFKIQVSHHLLKQYLQNRND